MLLRRIERRKNGKKNRDYSLVENGRVAGGRGARQHALYLGEINTSRGGVAQGHRDLSRCRRPPDAGLVPRGSWRGRSGGRRLGGAAAAVRNAAASSATVGRLLVGGPVVARAATRPVLAERLPASRSERAGTGSASAGRLPADRTRQRVAAASRVVRQQRDGRSAGADFGLAETHKLYACHGLLLAHKDALFSHLTERWRDLFNANFDVLLYGSSTCSRSTPAGFPRGRQAPPWLQSRQAADCRR